MLGRHNALNAIAAIAVAREMGLEEAGIRKALANFGGVKRRFTRTGEAGSIAVIDDYGHHPVEIAAVLAAARQAGSGRVIAVVQPHRYSRLHDLFRSEEHTSELQSLMRISYAVFCLKKKKKNKQSTKEN